MRPVGAEVRGLLLSYLRSFQRGFRRVVTFCGNYSEAACSSGYSPFLNFVVPELSDAVPRLLMLGAIMDGPIKYPANGKVRGTSRVESAVHCSLIHWLLLLSWGGASL